MIYFQCAIYDKQAKSFIPQVSLFVYEAEIVRYIKQTLMGSNPISLFPKEYCLKVIAEFDPLKGVLLRDDEPIYEFGDFKDEDGNLKEKYINLNIQNVEKIDFASVFGNGSANPVDEELIKKKLQEQSSL